MGEKKISHAEVVEIIDIGELSPEDGEVLTVDSFSMGCWEQPLLSKGGIMEGGRGGASAG